MSEIRKLMPEDMLAFVTIATSQSDCEYMRCFNCGQDILPLTPFIIRSLSDGRIMLLHRIVCEANPHAFTEAKERELREEIYRKGRTDKTIWSDPPAEG